MKILFFADKLPPMVGGMEVHAGYFIKYFTDICVISKQGEIDTCCGQPIDLANLNYIADIVFFNSGRWIKELSKIKRIYPYVPFVYRTGGNEIIKSHLPAIDDYNQRKDFWRKEINENIDVIFTNSRYTEARLRDFGITTNFKRFVGGAKIVKSNMHKVFTIFCAARFVPYKNYDLFISIINKLYGTFKVRVAGNGPLFEQIKKNAKNIDFLGEISNEEVCREIYSAHLYLQLSADYVMQVPGGSYIHSEGMGRSILEALSAGTYVIAGKTGALPEIIYGDRGKLVDLDKEEEIVKTVQQAIDYPKQKLLRYDYSWERLFQNYEKFFEGLHENITCH